MSCITSLALFTVFKCVVHHIPNFLPVCREGEAEDSLLASHVLSSQIPGYDGGEVDTNETVKVMFPINVRKYRYLWLNLDLLHCLRLPQNYFHAILVTSIVNMMAHLHTLVQYMPLHAKEYGIACA